MVCVRVMVVMLSAIHSSSAFPSLPAPPFALVRAPFSVGLPQQPNALSPAHRHLQLLCSWRRTAKYYFDHVAICLT